MDHGNWLSLGETESSGSASSQSERLSDDQEYTASPNETSPVSTSPIHAAHSTEVSCKNDENEVHETVKDDVNETVKSLSEKLSAALLSISAKEDLVKQHSKVAEEAVSGWEKAETEVTVLKQKLEATTQKNSALEDKIGHLDGALKECVRQLRQSRDEQEQKVQDAVSKKTQEWESHRSQLENQLTQLKAQLETSKAESSTTAGNLQSKLEAIEKENVNLKTVLLKQSEELKVRTLERELSTQTAESASKQHLESIKKVAKLEAECRKLRVLAQKKSPVNDQKTMSSSTCVESLTDSQSDVEPSCSDSWASALIAELDQFKNEKSGAKVLTPSVDIDLMDDFLEMERLAALPETGNGSCSFGAEADSERVIMQENSSMVELEIVKEKMAELEEKLEKMVSEKAKLEMALADMQNHHENSCNQLTIAEDKLVQLQNELDRVKESKEAAMLEVASVESERKSLMSQLESTLLEVGKLQGESVLSSELKSRLETSDAEREKAESQLHVAHMEIENLLEKVGLLEGRVEEERVTATSLLCKVEEVEAAKNTMVSQFMSANLEVKKLKEMSKLLEQIIEEEKSLSTEFSATLKVVKDEKKAVELELVSAQSELQNLSEMVEFLQRRVETEKALKAQFAAKCQNLEDQLSNKSREVEVRLVSGLNGELSVKQGKELVVAAEKLAECQKTIASLGNQLKSLTALDDYIIDTEKMEFDGSSPDSCTLPNGKESCTLSSPPSSTSCVSGVGR